MRRVIFATTGFSFILDSLLKEKSISLIGIVDFRFDVTKSRNFKVANEVDYYIYNNDMAHLKAWIKRLDPDILIIYKMPFLLPEEVFSLPKFGSINIHPSLLPRYRGPNPWFWMYYNMETIGGITIHRIDKYEDHGEILAQKQFDIKLGEELHQLQLKAEQMIYPSLCDLIFNIDSVSGLPQSYTFSSDRAPNVSDYSFIINFKCMEGIRVWHLLRGFPHLIYLLTKKDEHEYEIGDFISEYDIEKSNAGQIIHDNKNSYLYCIDGKIHLTKKIKRQTSHIQVK